MNINILGQSAKQLAIEELSIFIDAQATALKIQGWKYFTTDKAPESFKALKGQTIGKRIPIANYGGDTSIYGDVAINERFRFWHDVTHLKLNEGFSKQGEYAVVEQHLLEAERYGLSPLAMAILRIDTKGQVDYYFRHKEFVQNQDAFLDTCLLRGTDLAIKVKH